MRAVVFLVVFASGSLLAATRTVHRSFVNGYPAAKMSASPSALDKLCGRLLPPEKVNAAVGFFAPVAKKYMPDFRRFSKAYETSTNKTAVVARYLPTADRALAEARVMRVPKKYEQEKAKYLQLFEAALVTARMYVKIAQMK